MEKKGQKEGSEEHTRRRLDRSEYDTELTNDLLVFVPTWHISVEGCTTPRQTRRLLVLALTLSLL